MCDAQCADEYCVRIYSEAKMHNTARAFRAFFSYLEYFSRHPNLGFWCFKNERKRKTSLEKKTVVLR